MDRRWTVSLVLLASTGLAACSMATPSPTAVPSATPSPSLTPTTAPSATVTVSPTVTHTPTATFEPAPVHDAAVVEAALRAEGYKRYPIAQDSWFWDNGSGVSFDTYPFGLEVRFLNDPGDQAGRAKLIDAGLDTVSTLFTDQFIADLRNEAHGFAGRVLTVTGDPEILDYGNGGSVGKLMQFNAYDTSIQNGPNTLPIEMSLLFREYKCKAGYLCYFFDMPTMTFTGGATLTFFDIWIDFRGN